MANAITHLSGAVLSLVGMIFLIKAGLKSGDPVKTAGLVVFALSMVLLYSASGFYHLVKPSNFKRILRILDHSNIYFLIAGTYTPILIAVGSPFSFAFIAVVWAIALLGILFTLVFWGRFNFFHVILYLAMGWLVVFIWKPVIAVIPWTFVQWIIAGGLTYTTGTAFYSMKKLPYYHAIWHLFVLAGSLFFYIGIYMYIPML
ncbi:MAG: hemolysin III family protein [Spirochaetaceae bacterium]|nr:hemolysin III family protein [Spirochaetaceae bacterium]